MEAPNSPQENQVYIYWLKRVRPVEESCWDTSQHPSKQTWITCQYQYGMYSNVYIYDCIFSLKFEAYEIDGLLVDKILPQ